MRTVRWVVATSTVAAVALSTWLIAGWGGADVLNLACNYGTLAFALFAAGCCGLAARWSTGRRRYAWIAMAVAVGAWATGSAVWIYYEQFARVAPFPSPADAAYLLFPIAACIGMALLPSGYSGHSHTRLMLDAFIVAAALFQISWVTVLQDVYAAGGVSRFAVGLAMAYPVMDMAAVLVAVLVLSRARTGQRRTLTLLAVGVVLMALSDSAFVWLAARDAYYGGTIADVGWVFGLLVIGVAALLTHSGSHSDSAPVKVPSRAALSLPYLPIAVAIAVCAPATFRNPGAGALFASAVLLVVAVLFRQFAVVRENRRLLETVADQAMNDPLTGLPNRALFNDRLDHAMQLHRRDGQSVAVLSVDLDDFKLVNDNFGHPAGDELLVLVGERLRGCVRPGDTVARLGGDEFAVLIEGKPEHSRRVAQRIVTAFDDLFVVHGNDVIVRLSIGLAVTPAGDTGLSADELFKQADVAMYSAKRSRTGGVHTFDPEMHLVARRVAGRAGDGPSAGVDSGARTFRLLGQLRHAIDHDGLTVVYQPKFDLASGVPVGVEALVRWPHPERGLLGPDQFLPLVREHGLMRAVTDRVLARALDDVAAWRADGLTVPVAVNVFAPALCDLALPDRIVAALDARRLNPNLLTIEITEDLLLDNLARTKEVLDRLRRLGIRVAIDDFGSGYSALSYLCELPVDEVKLDRRFIAPILVDERAAAVVRAVVALARDLDMTTVAEGVENAATATRLGEYGCKVAQGFHYSRPLAAPDVKALLAASSGFGQERASAISS